MDLPAEVQISNELIGMKGGKATDTDQIKQLVSAAVGADAARGDQVAVMVRKFDATEVEALPFYEAPWFATVLRNGVALIALLLVLLLGVRPLIKAVRRQPGERDDEDAAVPASPALPTMPGATTAGTPPTPLSGAVDNALLGQQISLAQRMIEERPDSAVVALRQMLKTQAEKAQ